jgi:hypothetical protein
MRFLPSASSLSAAYLVSDVETFVPLTASLRAGATAF